MNAVEEDDCLWSILLHRGCALAKKRTAPVGRVGWRFRRDSLGSRVCVAPEKPQSCTRGPAKPDNSK